ncbi:MAG: 3-dehydroquinate synthase [Acidobacteria bacterium]|nr:3-dehydroquinate synthase [Acidobacteriota bacterium]MCA1639493.1 3-dehydroquinate synthase [Acidobacteriota bacterium]
MEKVTVKLNQTSHTYNIKIGNNLLKASGDWARMCLSQKTKKIAVVSNRKVFGLYGEAVKKSFEKSGFESHVFLMKDGEKYKNFHTLEEAVKFFTEKKLTRTDTVVALGGGVVGDLAGFASAVFLRGISFLQIPTTLLAMIDSSVGGKTGVNTKFGKNLMGAFHQPNGVLIDVETLQTLPRRELTAGFCEAIKQGAIADKKLFNQTAEFLENYSPNRFKNYFKDEKFLSELGKLIAAQVAFKAKIVMQDEKENTERVDSKSRKILNFGHTLAHALEKVTDYKRFKHGEAVGYGILFAAELSKRLDILDENELNLLENVVGRAGALPENCDINSREVLEAFAFDKKSINDSLQWILLESIGKPLIYKNKNIPQTFLETTLKEFLRK